MNAQSESQPLPLPVTTAWSDEFWSGLHEEKFLLQRCQACGAFQGYPKPLCHRCGEREFEWVESSGRGSVYTHTTLEANPPTPFVPRLPYTLVIVELDEGVRYLAAWADSDPPTCGMKVEAVYRPREDGAFVPTFTAATA